MCGIFGYVGTELDGAKKVINGLRRLEYRGYDSWGVVAAHDHTLVMEKHIGKIGDAKLTDANVGTSLALGHTRWATHGGVTIVNAHPHLSTDGKFAVVHNGIIENYQQLKEELTEKGYTFTSQTDTEVLVHLISDTLKSTQLHDAIVTASQHITGMNAFVIIDLETETLTAFRNGSPLVLGKGADGYYLASDAVALAPHCKSIYFLEDEELVVLTAQSCQLYDARDKATPVRWQENTVSDEDLDKGIFPHYLLKEIHEQPTTLTNLAQHPEEVIELSKHLSQRPVFVGCGSAFHASLSGKYYLAEIANLFAETYFASEFSHFRKLLHPNQLVTMVTQSGETIDLVEHLPFLAEKKIRVGAITNRVGSTIERKANVVTHLNVGTEQAVLATKSYTAMVAVFYLLAHALDQTLDEASKKLEHAAQTLSELLQPNYRLEHLMPVVQKLKSAQHVFVVGRGNSYPVALEAALKIKEVTYLHTEGFAGGELKHGVIALIEEGTPCIVFVADDEEHDVMLSNAMELKSRGGCIIGVSSKDNEIFDYHLPVFSPPELSAITMAVPIQLLAYELAVTLGRDPDKPRNLAKSVTVK